MIKVIFSFLVYFIFSAAPLLGQGNSQEPPNRVKVNFNARYPDNSGAAKWQQNGEGYTASFRQNGQPTESEFDKNGRWVKSNTQVQENKLPADAKKYIKENYPEYQYTRGVKYENQKSTRYEIDIKSQNKNYRLQFNQEGAFIDEKSLN